MAAKRNEKICSTPLTDKKDLQGPSLKNKPQQQFTRQRFSKDNSGTLVPYDILAVLRILLTLIPQIGYIHPDEYFQSVEIVNGDLFGYDSKRPWEFNETFPVRSAAIPHLFYGVPMFFWKMSSNLILSWSGVDIMTPYFHIVLPRVIMCFFSFINDLCLFKISYTYGQNYKSNLVLLASSYVMMVYGSRTFSNTIEMFLSSLLITLVANSMASSEKLYKKEEFYKQCYDATEDLKEKVKYHRLRYQLPWHTLSSVFPIGTIIVVGTFNRPTFLAFAFVPVFFWLMRGLTTRLVSPFSEFHLRSAALVISALPSFALLVSLDSLYYRYIDLRSLVSGDFSLVKDFVVTPYNFILYNANVGNLAEHGLHCRLTHIFVNIPLLFNVIGVISIISVFTFLYRLSVVKSVNDLPRVQSIMVMTTCSYLLPVIALSLFPHQEPRFLLPCLFPLVFLHSNTLRSKKSLLYLWYFFNAVLTIYFAFVQQAGIYGLMQRLHKEMMTKPRLTHVHVMTTHSYPLPMTQLQLEYSAVRSSPDGTRYQKSRDFFLYELGSAEMPATLRKLISLRSSCKNFHKEKRIKYRLYFVLPTSLQEDFEAEAAQSNLTYEIEASFYPHFSFEAPPKFQLTRLLASCSVDFFFSSSDSCNASGASQILSYILLPVSIARSFFNQLGLAIVRIH